MRTRKETEGNTLILEDTTTTTPTNFASESFNASVYAIVRQGNTAELRMIERPYQLRHEPTDSEIREFKSYAPSLSCAYTSYIPECPEGDAIGDLKFRKEAIAMNDTIKDINNTYSVVACSHRYGGWTGIKWDFGQDVKFTISTNFGFGSASYFRLLVQYKGVLLTPYMDYIRYRYADFSTLYRYTQSYALVETEWKKVMGDALGFYNGIVHENTGFIFAWLIKHLERMTAGIEELRNAMSFTFYRSNGSSDVVKGDELIVVKANKIANSLDFVENISVLPTQVTPKRYVDRLVSVCRTYLPQLIRLIEQDEIRLAETEKMLEVQKRDKDYVMYSAIRNKWYHKKNWFMSGKRQEMLRFLLRMQRLTAKDVTREERRKRLTNLKNRLDEINKLESTKRDLTYMLNNLKACRTKIEMYFEDEKAKAV